MSAPYDEQSEAVPQPSDPAETPRSPQSGPENGLTGIQGSIHCPLPSEGNEIRNELEELEVQQFIDTAAEIAFNIARRKQPSNNSKIPTSRSETP